MCDRFDAFAEKWWSEHSKLAKTELAQNGQFDELVYIAFDSLVQEENLFCVD